MEAVYLPSSLKSIIYEYDNPPFLYCDKIKLVSFNCNFEDKVYLEKYFGTEAKDYIVGENVTMIKNGLFRYLRINKLTLKGNITKIETKAFENLEFLDTLEINSKNISSWFATFPIKKVIFGDNVETIGDYAFNQCSNITSVALPQNLKCIGENAFSGCQMASITILEKVDTIGASAFKDCTQLTKVVLSKGNLKCIGDEAFSQCPLTDIEIPDGVKKIGKLAFGGCKKLVNVSMPNSVDVLGVSAFSGCESLQNVTLSESLKRLNDNLFSGCSSITSINLPNNLTAIGVSSFDGCNSLQEVNLPNSITSIGNKAFANCSSIASINIPSSLKSIGTDAFKGCGKLQKVFVSDLAAWCGITFDGYDGSNNPLSIAHHLYNEDGTEITDLVIPDGVANINSYAFYGGSSLTSVTVPGSLKKIGSRAFDGCSGLTKVTISDLAAWCKMTFTDNPLRYAQRLYDADGTEIQDLTIPTGIEGISNKAFAGCSSLKSLVIPNGVEYIGYDAFYGCQNLATVVIPNSVKEIGSDAFADCMSLYSVTSLVNMPFKLNESAFAYTGYDYDKDIIYNIAKLYVPTGRSAVYGATTGWKKFMNIMEIDTKFKLTYIVDGTEYKTYEVQATEVVTPEPDPYKEGYIFSGWSRIPSIMPAEDVTVYGSFAVDPNYAGIDWVTDNETKPKAYYSVDGKRLETEQKGLNIIRMSDGTTRKVVVK